MKTCQQTLQAGQIIPLADLPLGKWGTVHSIRSEGITRRRMLDLGLVPGTRVEAVRNSPAGDPTAFNIRGALIAFRKEEGQKILVEFKGE